ncbi:sugar ABC transporter ATP-binding protein [Conexibacter woesei]|uniref:ABC transporter related protein n=1 Tax=Conexibacter woesei (strain DSM 14684 / CCUG 47730 / CIP 108061 / JCM 11494 / NBRC 100937 / ID131577) TaxID=469383 RepID=D3F5H3_CONWI|nr:sugar ABC transporter ATP-binding protein [Conexibacter woesei]ADB50640.1 ABC transporter related protein [Conexibacter woesei DSM 14684]
MSDAPHLRLRGIGRSFGGVAALRDVDLDVARGTVHAVVGENGAGKSTLGKVISGVIAPDRGTIAVAGRRCAPRSPREALALGVATIAQEVALVPQRSVLDNVLLGVERRRGGIGGGAAARSRYEALVERVGLRIEPGLTVGALGLADQQKVELLRAFARDAELIVLDEPTAALEEADRAELVEVVRRLARAGTTFVFVSHFLEEVLAVADAVSVMRDGRLVRTASAAGETQAGLIEAMLGRPLESAMPPRTRPRRDAAAVLSVERLARPPLLRDATVHVRAGEIVGCAGLAGSGRSELARAIFGADRATAGTIRVGGTLLRARRPGDAMRAGVAMVPERRKEEGLLMGRSIVENVSLPRLGAFSRCGVLARRRERADAAAAIAALDVRAASPDAPVATLSGGNQQKVLFARWLCCEPRVLIADEPTRGVDVGAKRAIYDLIARLAADGMGVLLISSELEEIAGLADRVYVMRAGRTVAELTGGDVGEAAIGRAMFAGETRR